MLKPIVLNLCLLLPLSIWAKTPEPIPEDFARGIHIEANSKQPFYRLPLPDAVYTGAAHPDLRDIRVYNNGGENVPFALVAEPTPTRIKAKNTLLQAFKLPSKSAEKDESGTVVIERQNVHLSWSNNPENKLPQLLLIAPGKDEEQTITLSAIQLKWADSNANWQQEVTLESSSDLSDWSTVSTAMPLMDLKQAGQRLRIDTLKFPQTTARYWRLTLSQKQAPELKTITGIDQTETSNTPLTWVSPSKIDKPDTWQRIYQFALAQPLESLKITLPQANTVLPYTLEYRDNPKNPWQPLSQNVAWRLNLNNGNEHQSAPLEINGISAQELRLTATSGWGSGEPTVEIGRHSLNLLFNARGGSPYLLTWGSAAAPAASLSPNALIPWFDENTLSNLPIADTTNAVELGGEKRRFEPSLAERQARWQTQLLWAVLIAGVAGLAGLAFKLWREMSLPSQKPVE